MWRNKKADWELRLSNYGTPLEGKLRDEYKCNQSLYKDFLSLATDSCRLLSEGILEAIK